MSSRNFSLSSVIIDLIAALRSFIVYAGGAVWLPSDSALLAASLMEPEASAALACGFWYVVEGLALPLPLLFGLVGHSQYMWPVFLQLKHLPSFWSFSLSAWVRRCVTARGPEEYNAVLLPL